MKTMMMMLLLYFMIASAEKDLCSYPQSCGDVSNISYPFSIHDSCGLPPFHLDCRNDSGLDPDKLYPFLNTINPEWPLQVLKISADSILVNITKSQITAEAENCDNLTDPVSVDFLLPAYPSPYLFSNSNTFTTWNCGLGMFQTGVKILSDSLTLLPNDTSAIGACFSDCTNSEPGTCKFPSSNISPLSGQDYPTCCSTNIPQPTRGLVIYAYPRSVNISGAPCSVAANFFFVQEYQPTSTTFPLKLDWAIPYNKSFNPTLIRSDPSFACHPSSQISFVPSVPGYICGCPYGFTGDGYEKGTGCQDINECAQGTFKCDRHEVCKNRPGDYICICQFSCKLLKQIIPVSISLAAILLVFTATNCYNKWKQRMKVQHIINNGGLQLGALMDGGAKLYTIDELVEATSNFSPSNRLGTGGSGIVYKGILKKEQDRAVAIKKARQCRSEEVDRESIRNEVTILTSINHRNIVRMIGYCVETRLPLLVYEYFSNGSLEECLHLKTVHLPWNKRFEIAIQAADALAYLHSSASPRIFHRDVKTGNILLDENMDAKVADFGASRLNPDQQSSISLELQGTPGYFDPEYVQSMQYTEKSDVYGFGVVLAELLTGLKPLSQTRQGNNVNLAVMFLKKVSEARVMDIVDRHILSNEVRWEEAIARTADLTVRCLAMIRESRPSMLEVYEELKKIKRLYQSSE